LKSRSRSKRREKSEDLDQDHAMIVMTEVIITASVFADEHMHSVLALRILGFGDKISTGHIFGGVCKLCGCMDTWSSQIRMIPHWEAIEYNKNDMSVCYFCFSWKKDLIFSCTLSFKRFSRFEDFSHEP
jgi:hypothetical protein